MRLVENRQDTHDSVPPPVQWGGGAKQSESGRLSTNTVVATWTGRMGPSAPPDHESFPRDTPFCHWRNCEFDDVGPGITPPRSAAITPPPLEVTPQNEYCQELLDRLEVAHAALREQQRVIKQEDQEEPLLFSPGDMVWLENRRRRKDENPKLQAKFQGPYTVIRSWPNHTYQIERSRQTSIQNEGRLKAYRPCPEEVGRASVTLEPNKRPNMKGAIRRRERTPSPEPWMIPPCIHPSWSPPLNSRADHRPA